MQRVNSIHVPSSSVVTIRIWLLLLWPIVFVANIVILYVVQGRRPVREAFVEELDTTQALLESDPWQTTPLKIWLSSLISTVKFSMALFPSKPAVQEIFTTREPFESTVNVCGGSGTTVELNNTSLLIKMCNFTKKMKSFKIAPHWTSSTLMIQENKLILLNYFDKIVTEIETFYIDCSALEWFYQYNLRCCSRHLVHVLSLGSSNPKT